MSHFCFQATQTQQLSQLTLRVGEEARPILWKGVGPDDPVHTAVFFQDPTVVFFDEKEPVNAPQRAFRKLELTGRSPGTGRFRAVEVPRTGDLRALGEIQIDVQDVEDKDADLTYSGKFLYWHRSQPTLVRPAGRLLFAATSGDETSQMAAFQTIKNRGPLPEGLYSFVTHVNPRQNSVRAANLRGDAAVINHPGESGIEFLPIGGAGPTQPAWGTFRVALTPVRGNMHGRDSFYLHNSHKGFSHGCIEVGSSADGDDFFTLLLAYSAEKSRKRSLTLRVKYSYPEQFTLGATKKP
ncbi:hypothetical protein [Streptomyces sp. NPDC001435]|uniref:hypothetical protein n=1 Tax=unclassified Streptomyces TaxID=2593676 RepID=UPI00367B3C1A